MIDTSSEKEKFASQQQTLDFLIHACDSSTSTRKFETLKTWSWLLFEEFFAQGDSEKVQNRPPSFLCERKTVNIPKEQVGYCNFIVLPLWDLVATIMPKMEPAYQRAEQNRENWKTYEETDEDK